MKNKRSYLCLSFQLLFIHILSGCASYNASPLSFLSPELIQSTGNKDRVLIAAKAFNTTECMRYLDRDVLQEGYQPIQLYIQNNTDKSYIFSSNRLSFPVAKYKEVAVKVHTSTIGRVLGYGIPGLLLIWPLIIPAIVDGLNSSEANDILDSDFLSKTINDQEVIFPHSHMNGLLFVPADMVQRAFDITLIEAESKEIKTFNVGLM